MEYMKEKPIKFACKISILCICHRNWIQRNSFPGKDNHDTKLGLGGLVVSGFFPKLNKSVLYDITFENLFTLINLVNHLSEYSTGGTPRANRTDKCPIGI